MWEFVRQIPDGDERERLVCPFCGHIAYENPKPVVGTVVVHDGRVLLCRRAIPPRRGFWTLPAGYLEMGETVEEGARREAREETGARVTLDGVLAIYSISHIGQVQVIFRGRFDGPEAFAAGPESEAVAMFAWEDIPWAEIAFPTVTWALRAWHAAGPGPLGAPVSNPPEDPRGETHLPPEPAGSGAAL
jgi:ADP-ribose pyrophosphatase YjhB (NUDIX family)